MKNITTALLAIQAELPKFIKDRLNPYYNSKFVELSTILETLLPILHKNKIILLQPTGIENGVFVVQTRLLHESGEEAVSSYILDCEKGSPQKLAAALTFARRYALVSLLGISCESDDDGNAAEEGHRKLAAKPAAKSTAKPADALDEINYSTFVPINYSEKNFGTEDDPRWSYSVQDSHKIWYAAWDDDLGTLLRDAKENHQEVRIGWRIKGKYKNIVDVNPAIPV